MTRTALVLLASALAAAPVAAAPCPMIENRPKVLTADAAVMAADGGILVGLVAEVERDAGQAGAVAQWRFADGTTPTIRSIAPGLDLLVATGPATLEDSAHHALVHVTAPSAKAAPILAAPAVTKIVREAPRSARHPYVSTTATLTADPPAGVIAIVTFDATGKVPRSWSMVTPNEKTAYVFSSGSCGGQIAGTVDSQVGDKVTLAWVDASGRLSKRSAPITVTAGARD